MHMSRKKFYRCPVLNLAQAREDIRDKIRAFVQSHATGDPAVIEFIHQHDQCDQQAEFVRFVGENVAIPSGTSLDQLPLTATGKKQAITQRDMIVRCPIHGEQVYSTPEGHHVTERKKKGLKI
jgi:hypothetical protein